MKEEMEFKERKDITQISTEYVFETCALDIPRINLLVIVLYWPEKNRETDLFFDSSEQLLHTLRLKDSRINIMIGGDCNLIMLDKDRLTLKLLDLKKSFNLYQYINEATRVTTKLSKV